MLWHPLLRTPGITVRSIRGQSVPESWSYGYAGSDMSSVVFCVQGGSYGCRIYFINVQKYGSVQVLIDRAGRSLWCSIVAEPGRLVFIFVLFS